MYTIVWSAGGVHGANWIAVAAGVFLDFLSYSGRRRAEDVPAARRRLLALQARRSETQLGSPSR